VQPPGQVLVFDADDTLWENNLLFERVIDDFLGWLAHPTLDHGQVRAVFNDIEAANTIAHGYGSRVFLGSLADCFTRLNERPVTEVEQREIEGLARALLEHRVELVPAVSETLQALGQRHDLRLLTKGDTVEQQRKIDASQLAHHFRSIHIVPEKDVAAYDELADSLRLDRSRTWMIGNSPKSDIRPARAAGYNAVFIPNDNTWALEHDELPDDPGVLHLRALPDLLAHF
jgi:putative hydrolase of the HAD superfamily